MHVKLKVSKVIQGKHYSKGDWVSIGNDLARKWIAAEHAESLNPDAIFSASNSGVLYTGNKKPILPFTQLPVKEGQYEARYEKTMLMSAGYSISDRDAPDLIKNAGRFAIFFDLLETWDVLLILSSFEINASKIAPEEHEITRALVHDLRVPYFQRCIIGVRNSENGRLFCEALAEESERGRVLAPLRALWRVMPLAYYLPPTFGKKESA